MSTPSDTTSPSTGTSTDASGTSSTAVAQNQASASINSVVAIMGGHHATTSCARRFPKTSDTTDSAEHSENHVHERARTVNNSDSATTG